MTTIILPNVRTLESRVKRNPRESITVKIAKRAHGIKIARYRDGPRVRPGNKIGIYTTRLLVQSNFLRLPRQFMRVLRFKRRTHLLVFQISGRKRDVSIRSAMLSAETSNHILIPALLNLLQRRNSRGPTPPPPGGSPPASYQRARNASPLRNLYIGPSNALGYCP